MAATSQDRWAEWAYRNRLAGRVKPAGEEDRRASGYGTELCTASFRSRTSIAWACPASPDLNLSNRPVRTRMPGGVGGTAAMFMASLSRFRPCHGHSAMGGVGTGVSPFAPGTRIADHGAFVCNRTSEVHPLNLRATSPQAARAPPTYPRCLPSSFAASSRP